MASNQDFPAPSKDELEELKKEDFPEPSKEDLSSLNASDISIPQALGAGAIQGGTLGFADEMGGGIQALLDKLNGNKIANTDAALAAQGFTGDLLPSSGDIYRKATAENRAEDKAIAAAHPTAHLVGNLAGGLATAPLLAPAGGVNTALQAGKVGALAGGLAGLGGSEADLTQGNGSELGHALMDTGGGAVLGGLGGAALQKVPDAFGALKEMVKKNAAKFQVGKKLGRAFNLGEMGQGISTDANVGRFTGRVNKEAQKLTDYLLDNIENNYKDKLTKLEGKHINLTEFLQNAEQQVDDAVGAFKLDPAEAENIKNMLKQNLYKKLPNAIKKISKETRKIVLDDTGNEVMDVSKELTLRAKGMSSQDLNEQAANVPLDQFAPESSQINVKPKSQTTVNTELQQPELRGDLPATQAAQIVRNLQNAAFEQRIANPGKASVMKSIAKGGSDLIKNEIPETAGNTGQISSSLETLENAGQPTLNRTLGEKQSAPEVSSFIQKLTDLTDPANLQKKDTIFRMLEKINPDFAKSWMARAEKVALDKDLVGEAGKTGLDKLYGTVEGSVYKTANVAGLAKNIANKKVGAGVSKLLGLPSSKLQYISTNLKNSANKSHQRLGQMIESTLAGSPEKRSAMLFAISQNKEYRDLLDSMTPDIFGKDDGGSDEGSSE